MAKKTKEQKLEELKEDFEKVVDTFITVLDVVSGTPLELDECVSKEERKIIRRVQGTRR